VRAASFGQAAERLHITQPALSKSIRNLERTLGCTLLERHPGGVVPTDYGRVFLDYAALVTSELDRAVEELNALKGHGSGVVRVGAGATMMQYLLPQAVRAYVAADAGGSVTFRQGLRDELVALLRRGEVDLIVGSVGERCDEDLHQQPLLRDRLVVLASEGHPLIGREGLSVNELAAYRWVLPDTSEAEGDRLTRAFAAAGLPPPAAVVRTQSSVFMAAMLRGTDYLSYCPVALLSLDAEFAHLRPLDLAEPVWPSVTVGITTRRRGVTLMPVRRFINRLLEVGRGMQSAA
jgi:DNA-binding transcriptional LysR family regulator